MITLQEHKVVTWVCARCGAEVETVDSFARPTCACGNNMALYDIGTTGFRLSLAMEQQIEEIRNESIRD